MAGKPIKIEYIAEVAQYLRETKKLEVSTEDIADALVATSNSADDLERKLSRAMKDAAKDTETLERAIKDLPQATGQAARDIDRDMDKVGDSMADAGKESAQEFKQNLGESLSSGDISSIIQDTAGGLVSGLSGPLSVAAAGLAGIATLAFAEIQRQAEELKAFTESLGGAIRGLYEQGIKTQDSLAQLEAFNTFLEEQADTVQGLKDDFANAGVASEDYLTSIFKGGPALDAQRQTLLDILATIDKQSLSAEGLTLEQLNQSESARELLKFLEAQSSEQADISSEMGTQATASQELARQLGLVDTNADGVIDASDKIATNLTTANKQAGGLKQNLDNIPSMIGVEIKYTATGFTGGAFQVTGGQLTPVYKETTRGH